MTPRLHEVCDVNAVILALTVSGLTSALNQSTILSAFVLISVLPLSLSTYL
jgi:hypothetical protein